jgi:uncharacterized protein involved in tolerance to divalent cations
MKDFYFNKCDHHYIKFLLDAERGQSTAARPLPMGWDTSRGISVDSFQVGLLLCEWIANPRAINEEDADYIVRDMEAKIILACDYALPKRRIPKPGKPSVYWWNDEVATKRRACIAAQRTHSRVKSRIARLRQRAAEYATL